MRRAWRGRLERGQRNSTRPRGRRRPVLAATLSAILLSGSLALGHIVPPEKLHPAAESYRRLTFVLSLNPVPWDVVRGDLATLQSQLNTDSSGEIAKLEAGLPAPGASIGPVERKGLARSLFEASTRALAAEMRHQVGIAERSLDHHRVASGALDVGRQLYEGFAPTLRATDPDLHRQIGQTWLVLSSALGSPGVLGRGGVAADRDAFASEAGALAQILEDNYGARYRFDRKGPFAPLPVASTSFDAKADLPILLPPGTNINKQLPRPRQILNMATRGVDESETTLVALGDMAFDSPFIFGEPARSLGISCNTCHNKSITNPGFFIPGLSARPGGMDVSNSFFGGHANNGHFDHIDTPDLRGIRFTAPYGRNGRFASLREFVRNVVVGEFSGAEPSPVLLDGLIAYMLEFDFLPNPLLAADGRLTTEAPPAAQRGQEIFHRSFESMGGRSCATCHVPSDHFIDRKSHDIGSTGGSEPFSRDRALDTPTLLSAATTGPYFHDGSLPSLRAVNEWFNDQFQLDLSSQELDDLTAYVETVASGTDAYEDTVYTLEAELEEFGFFLSTYDFLKRRGRIDLIETTLETVAFEIEAHKWDVQDPGYLPVLDQLIVHAEAARAALGRGDVATADSALAAYLDLYEDNMEGLK